MPRKVRLGLFLLAGVCGAAQAQWMDFKWVAPDPGDPSSGQHAALLLPVTLEGAACWMQLDTGADASVLYRPRLPAAIRSDGPTASVRLNVGGMAFSGPVGLMYPDDPGGRTAGCRQADHGVPAGTLADDVFLDRALELDLRNGRFRIFARADARPPLSAGSRAIPFTLGQAPRGKVPVLSARLPDGRSVALTFDTGSAPIDLLVFRQSDWLALVGPAQAARATTTTASSWEHPITCSRAPTEGTIRLQGMALPKGLEATYCALPEGPAFAGNPEYGVLGLKPFYRDSLVIDFAGLTLHVREPDDSPDTP